MQEAFGKGNRVASKQRLTKADWVAAGLEALEQKGFLAVRAEVLSEGLGVSRGSFYWHFDNVAAFETALIERWRDLILAAVWQPLLDLPPRERFRRMMEMSMGSERRLETAFRAWAAVNPRMAKALAQVDSRRLERMTRLIESMGTPPPLASSRAAIAYWTYLGHATGPRARASQIEAVVAELVRMAVSPAQSNAGSA